MRRLTAISFLLLLATASCDNSSSPPSEGTVRGLGFTDPISNVTLHQLGELGTVLSVSYSARVVMMQTTASHDALAAVAGAPFVGSDLGQPDTVRVEAEAEYAEVPTTADLLALSAIGTITNVFDISGRHSVFLQVPVRDIGRLDNVPNTLSIWVGYDKIFVD